ncbi:putative RNA-binding Zn-ribbon protein involved in translation (DUF1610 family) [Catalinimonas alkaloidigena]|uniref:hypothetical protein n=1 Tax=Catalinimonas alkaloidigena TaxID=1075417 RepID=UPI002404B5BF|nr:hypothetical protein [Catalinimonas alkaloidigena]MDF9796328.1 putative RNA-binding Zn-ribbon protein involved in translation (DUF1610 family) [Catalinimonas alkaloidigena]
MKKEIRICDECYSEYYADTSRMGKLCPNCSHFLYGYDNCQHVFRNGRCEKCYWNGETTKFIESLKCKKMTFSETIEWLTDKSIEYKILFNKLMLFNLTIMNRTILDDNTITDKTKMDCLIQSNELAHNIWKLIFKLEKGKDDQSAKRLVGLIKFYQKKSKELEENITTTFKTTIGDFIFY